MKTKYATTLIAISIALIAASPVVQASTLTVSLNPQTKEAYVVSSSTTDIIMKYPENSPLSGLLNGYHHTATLSGSFAGNDHSALFLQGRFEDYDSHISIQNLTVSYSAIATGNSTTLTVHKQTNITAWVKGMFTVVNGTVKADLRWRSFAISGPWALALGGQEVEVNEVGSSVGESLGDHATASGDFLGMFGGYGLWHTSTLNFSQLNTPLSTWTKNYDASTNTTTFSKTISGTSTFSASATFDGKTFSLSVKSDPSASIATKGYAVASGDSLSVVPAPGPDTSTLGLIAVAAVAFALAGAYVVARRARRTSATPQASIAPIQ